MSLSIGYFFPAGQTNHVWSDEAARRTPRLNRENLLELARTAEDVGFDSLFIADNWSGHQRAAELAGHQSPAYHAPLLAMGIFAVTERIGVVSTFHTTHHKPAHVARMGATLADFSSGRWGWNVVTGFSDAEAALFGEEFVPHDERYEMAAEFVDVVDRLWTEQEPFDHDGRYYRMKGRIKAPRPAARPRLVSAGASEAGTAFAARYCDELVTLAKDDDGLRGVESRLAGLTAGTGRNVSVTPFAIALVRENEGEAEEEYARLLESLNHDAAWEIAGDILGSIESARAMFDKLGEDKAVRALGSGEAMIQLVGTPEQVAERLTRLTSEIDIRNILVNFPLWSPAELRGFGKVLDLLADAGVWSRPSGRPW
ncbi:LLM class flavin-dependent oxidoreductase [Pseudonocardia nematodicida]|uniref:LLM class flavin-dependent oxidoreductase n=1 Tax=Pseudonocardia nematodicida TaxID=1206997 RepID=A0ABV1K7G4_9PSEU